MDKTKKITIGLYALSIFLIFGISYAYFSLNIIGNDDAKLSVITAGTLELTYTDGSGDVILENVIPGSSIQKEITVKNTGTLDTAYNLVWGEMINEFENDEIVLSATCERLNSEGTIDGTCNNIEEKPVINNIIQKNISIESGITHKYTITVTFIETGENQNYNQGKVFGGIINLNEYSNIAGTLKNKFYEVSGRSDRSLVKTISFYSDNRVIDGAESYDVSEEQNRSVLMYVKQNSENNSLYDLSIVADGKIAFPEDSSELFSFKAFGGCSVGFISNLSSIEFNNSIDTSIVTNMSNMFSYNQATTIDLSSFDTHNVTNMNFMFSNSKATTLDLSNFNTHNVTDMNYMFYNSKATVLDLSNFDTSIVTNMSNMFSYNQATTIDLSSFDTHNVTNMNFMFSNSKATTLDLSKFDTHNVTDMSGMFNNSKATTLDLSSFNTSKVTNMSSIFASSQATSLDLSNFDTSKVTNMQNMFSGSKATTLDLSNFNTSKVTDMSNMFSYSQATTLDLSNFDTSNVTLMYDMFKNSNNLKTIYASSKHNTSKVTSSSNMFTGCTSLVGGQGTTYNSAKIDKTYARIDGGTSNPGYFTSKN